MTRKRSIGGREMMNLTVTGGNGCRKRQDSSDWQFSTLTGPTRTSNETLYSIVNHGSFANDSPDTGSISSHSIFVSDEDTLQAMTDDDSDAGTVDDIEDAMSTDSKQPFPGHGNRIIDFNSLKQGIHLSCYCRQCAMDDWESFLLFCDKKSALVQKEAANQRTAMSKWKYVGRHMNIRDWYKEWKEIQDQSKGQLTVEECTYGLASNFTIKCHTCKQTEYVIEAKKSEIDGDKTKSDLCRYQINVQFSLALQLMGIGGGHASTLAAFLDLPFPNKWGRQFNVLEDYMYEVIQRVKNSSQSMAVEEEILETVNDQDRSITQNKLEDDLPLHRIEASFDMGWQVRSSGGKYGSRTGHALLIGARTKKVLDSVVYNKKCNTCDLHYSLVGSYDNVKKHHCMRNYQGTSKAMEAEGLVAMLQRAPKKNKISICTIISDDDSNGRAKARHINKGGKLLETVEEPEFLADPSHRKRVFARAIYNLASAPVKTSRVTKGLAGHLKYCYGACVKRNRHLKAEELSEKVANILEHVCNNHISCDAAWCYDVKAKEAGKVYSAPKDHRINKEIDKLTYLQLKKIFDQYTSFDQMRYCNHPFDTQTNESLNESIARLAPKSVCYSGTNSLNSRIAIVIGIHNLGYHDFFSKVLQGVTVPLSSSTHLSLYLQSKDKRKEWKRNYDRKLSVKLSRSKQQRKSRQEIFLERTDNSYGPGVGLMAGINKRQKVAQTRNDEGTTKQFKNCKCGSTTHQRPTHRDCKLNTKNNRDDARLSIIAHVTVSAREAPSLAIMPPPPTATMDPATLAPMANMQLVTPAPIATTGTMDPATPAPMATVQLVTPAPIATMHPVTPAATAHPHPAAIVHSHPAASVTQYWPPSLPIMRQPLTMLTCHPAIATPLRQQRKMAEAPLQQQRSGAGDGRKLESSGTVSECAGVKHAEK
jgi:hypothetical protein